MKHSSARQSPRGSDERMFVTAPFARRRGDLPKGPAVLLSKVIFRDPSVFTGHIDESKLMTFTVTQKDPRFFELMEKFSGNEAGKNGITSLPKSSGSLTFILNHQPNFQNQPAGVYVWHALALYPDKTGDYVRKPMGQCSGREMLEELLHHLKFDADLKRISIRQSSCPA